MCKSTPRTRQYSWDAAESVEVCDAAIKRHIEPIPVGQMYLPHSTLRTHTRFLCQRLVPHGICAADVGPGELDMAFIDIIAAKGIFVSRDYSDLKAIFDAVMELADYQGSWLEMYRRWWDTDTEGDALIRRDIAKVARLSLATWWRLTRQNIHMSIHFTIEEFIIRLKAWHWRGDFGEVQYRWFWQRAKEFNPDKEGEQGGSEQRGNGGTSPDHRGDNQP